jgi:hypothetical protein
MSDTPEPEPAPPSSHAAPVPAGDRSRLALAVIGAIAVVALALSVWAVLGPLLEDRHSDGERADAKTKACAAFDVVRRGVQINTNMEPPGGPEDAPGRLAVAANARVALYDGGGYLLDRVDPATPDDVADPIRKFANALMDIGAAATAGAQNTDPDQAARLREADQTVPTITEKCQ